MKFIFATTEIRKVPVTVLSRCQRFDLRRVDTETLSRHFLKIAAAEGVTIAPGAVGLIARAADGSVRDGLSLLDQAIARATGEIGEADVRDMLGLADRVQIFDLFDSLMRGDARAALDLLGGMYAAGADPSVVMQDLLDLTHWLTRVKLVPAVAEAPGVPEAERVRGTAMAEKLSIPLLSRCWQMLLKGLGDVHSAPQALQAAEMVLIRLTHAASLPPPADLIRQLQEGGAAAAPAAARRRQFRAIDAGAPGEVAGTGVVAQRGRRSSARDDPGRCGDDGGTRRRRHGTLDSNACPRSQKLTRKSSPCCRNGARRSSTPSFTTMCISCASSPAGSRSGRNRRRPPISPTVSAPCSANGPAAAGWWPSRRSPAIQRWRSRKRPARPRRAPRSRPIPWCRRR